jgi:type III secretion protein HrpB1
MNAHSNIDSEASSLARRIVSRICSGELDEAETLLAQLHASTPASRDALVFPVMISILRGQLHDAWQMVNGLPDERCPELKAFCLHMLGDPTWHSYAVASEDSADPYVRQAMRRLLGRPVDTADASRVA